MSLNNAAGNFGFGGGQRSYSFNNFHADMIPASTVAVVCSNMACEWVNIQNDPSSSNTCQIGSQRLATDGFGMVLAVGAWSGWIPVNNLNKIWHKDGASSHLNYMMVW